MKPTHTRLIRDYGLQYTGAVGSIATTSVTVSPSPNWTNNQWLGKIVIFNTMPTGYWPESRVIQSNTADTISWTTPLPVVPAAAAAFKVVNSAWRELQYVAFPEYLI